MIPLSSGRISIQDGERVQFDIDNMALKLLDWLYEQGQHSTSVEFYDLKPFGDYYLNEDETAVRAVVGLLERQGLVNPTYSFGGTDAALTPLGIQRVQKLRADRTETSKRIPALRTAMLRWLSARESADEDVVSWDEFVDGHAADYLGERFKLGETERQADYLWSKGLIAAVRLGEERPGCTRPRLTSSGQDCAIDFGGNVSEYLNKPPSATNINNIHIADNRGNLSIAGEQFTQSITSGIDTSELLKFAGAVRQILPTLDLETEKAAELDRQAEELHEAASEPEPEVGRLKKLWAAVMQGITSATPTVASELVTNLGQEAARAIGAN